MPVWVAATGVQTTSSFTSTAAPGSTNMIYYQKSSYQRLAADVGIAYYEQRARARRSAATATSTPSTIGSRISGVVMTVLENRYPKGGFRAHGT